MNLFQEIEQRGFFDNMTHPTLSQILNQEKITFYVGFDPSAASFHLGQLAVFRLMSLLQQNGHTPLLIMGGATGSIGDPSGKDEERKLLTKEEIDNNIAKSKSQFTKFLDFTNNNKAKIFNNYDWTKDFSYLDFLRDIGKLFSVNVMTARESVKRRLEGSGITYTEFSYMLLQAYDFYYLYKNYNCSLQIGGSDQWGNIVAGIDLIRKLLSKQAYGITMPLLTKKDGSKFGKSAGNAVWLDKSKTSSFQLYQYCIRIADDEINKLLKVLSTIALDEIREIDLEHQKKPHLRLAQEMLANNIVLSVHGEEELQKAKKASQLLYGQKVEEVDDEMLAEVFADVDSYEIAEIKLKQGWEIISALVEIGITDSKAKARQLIKSGGIYLNNQRIDDFELKLDLSHKISKTFFFIRKGRQYYYLIKVK